MNRKVNQTTGWDPTTAVMTLTPTTAGTAQGPNVMQQPQAPWHTCFTATPTTSMHQQKRMPATSYAGSKSSWTDPRDLTMPSQATGITRQTLLPSSPWWQANPPLSKSRMVLPQSLFMTSITMPMDASVSFLVTALLQEQNMGGTCKTHQWPPSGIGTPSLTHTKAPWHQIEPSAKATPSSSHRGQTATAIASPDSSPSHTPGGGLSLRTHRWF